MYLTLGKKKARRAVKEKCPCPTTGWKEGIGIPWTGTEDELGAFILSSLVHSYKGLFSPQQCFLWGDKNLFQNVPSCGLRFPCWGLADEVAPQSPEAGQDRGELCPDLIHPAPHGHPVSQQEFCTRQNMFATLGVVTQQQGLLREVALTPHLEAFKTPGQPALGGPAWGWSCPRWSFEVSANLKHSVTQKTPAWLRAQL